MYLEFYFTQFHPILRPKPKKGEPLSSPSLFSVCIILLYHLIDGSVVV